MCVVGVAAWSASAAADNKIPWVAFNGGGSRSGINSEETTLTKSSVGGLKLLWSELGDRSHKDPIDSAPLFQPNVKLANGELADLLFLNSRQGTLYAVNADTGATVWQSTVVQDPCPTDDCITKSTPALDPSGKYVYCWRVDGTVRKYHVGSGEEVTGNGFPVVMTTDPVYEQGSAPINIFDNKLYMTTSGDNHDDSWYVGHIVCVDLSTGETTVWNALCADQRYIAKDESDCPVEDRNGAGIWSRGSVVDGGDGTIYVATGNGLFNANTNPEHYYYGDSLMRLRAGLPANATDVILDSYTPSNYDQMKEKDWDLGSSSPCLLPTIPQSKTPNMIVQASKDHQLRLINRDDMSGKGGPNNVGGEVDVIPYPDGYVFNHPLSWSDSEGNVWVFLITTDAQAQGSEAGFHAYQITTDADGASKITPKYTLNPYFGSSPFMAGNMLFVQGATGIRALEPTTGELLWQSSITQGLHWQSPIVVNGRVYTSDNFGYVYAWGL